MEREHIQKTARNFMESRILLTGVEINLFSLLAERALTADSVASELESDARGTTMLLDVLAALGYLIKESGVYRTEPSVSGLLSEDSPDSILPGLRHAAYLWHGWGQLTNIVLNGGHAEFPEEDREKRRKSFIGSMNIRATHDAVRLVQAVNPGQAKSLIDVGGAAGGYTIAFLEAVDGMKATLFDLPPVIEMARGQLENSGMLDRMTLVAGDFNEDDLPSGHDLALLSAIIHMNSRKQNLRLYRKVSNALDPGGRVIISDYVMESDRTRPVSGAVFAINMLVNTRGGGTWTFEEIREDLEEAGFKDIAIIDQSDGFNIVEGYKIQ